MTSDKEDWSKVEARSENSDRRGIKKYNNLKNIFIFFLIGILLFLIFQFYLILLAPIPLAFLLLRFRKARGIAIVTLVLSTVFLIIRPGINIFNYVLIISGYVSFVLAELFERGLSTERIVFFSSVASISLLSFFLVTYAGKTDIRLDQLVRRDVNRSIAEVISIYEEKGVESDQVAWFKDSSKQIEDALVKGFPAALVIFIISIIMLDYFLLRWWLGFLAFPLGDRKPFWQWILPDLWVWLFILSGGIWYIKNPIPSWISLNCLLVVSYLYLVQGMAILIFFFQKGRIPSFFRYLGLVLVFFVPGSYIFLTFGGLFDTWFDFRKLRINTKEMAA